MSRFQSLKLKAFQDEQSKSKYKIANTESTTKDTSVPKWFDLPEIPKQKNRKRIAETNDRKAIVSKRLVCDNQNAANSTRRYKRRHSRLNVMNGSLPKMPSQAECFGFWPLQSSAALGSLPVEEDVVHAENIEVREEVDGVVEEKMEVVVVAEAEVEKPEIELLKEEVSYEQLPMPISRKRKEITKLYKFGFLFVQKRMYLEWEKFEKLRNARTGMMPAVEFRDVLVNDIKVSQQDLRYITKIIKKNAMMENILWEPIDLESDLNPQDKVPYELFREVMYPANVDIQRWIAEDEEKQQELKKIEDANVWSLERINKRINDKRNALTVAFAKCVQGYEVFDVEDYPEGFEMLKNNLLQLTFAGSVPIWPRFIKTYKSILDHFISYEEFNGTKFQQVAHIIQNEAIHVLQQWCKSLKWRKGIEKCPERKQLRLHQYKRNVWHQWQTVRPYFSKLYEKLFRKLMAWRFIAKIHKARRSLQHHCFLPYLFWRRMTRINVNAKLKAKFLSNVFDTYRTKSHLRAWRRRIMAQIKVNAKIKRHRKKFDTFVKAIYMAKWHLYGQKRLEITKAFQKSVNLHVNFRSAMLKSILYLWRYYASLERIIARRSFHTYRQILEIGEKTVPSFCKVYMITDAPYSVLLHRQHFVEELGKKVYRAAKKKAKRESIGMAIFFKRRVRPTWKKLANNVIYEKKNRYAMLQGFASIKRLNFSRWVSATLYKSVEETQEKIEIEEEITPKNNLTLDWKGDKVWRAKGLAHSKQTQINLVAYRVKCEENRMQRFHAFQRREITQRNASRAETEFLNEKLDIAQHVSKKIISLARNLHLTRGQHLVDTFYEVLLQMQHNEQRNIVRSYFRRIRAYSFENRLTSRGYRLNIQKWLKTCARFRFIVRNIDKFRVFWFKRQILRRWLRSYAVAFTFETPGLVNTIRRQQRLLKKYHSYLDAHDAINSSALKAKGSCTVTFEAIFIRWIDYTQLSLNYEKTIALNRKRSKIRKLQVIFRSMQVGLKAVHTLEHREYAIPYGIKRINADLERIHTQIFVFRSSLLSFRLQKLFIWIRERTKKNGKIAPSLKVLLIKHRADMEERLLYEHRLMFKYFHERHVHYFEESPSNCHGAVNMGNHFSDPSPGHYCRIREIHIVSGRKVDGLKAVTTVPNSSKLMAAGQHGTSFGKLDIFILNTEEFLAGIETYADKEGLYAIKFATNTGRKSKWYGLHGKGKHNKIYANLKKWEEIVGFHGFDDKETLYALGGNIRETTENNIFAGLWKKGELNALGVDTSDREFAYFLQLRSCEVRESLERAHRLAIRMWQSSIVEEFNTLRIVLGLTKWIFRSLAHGLVQVSEEIRHIELQREKGIQMRQQGAELQQESMQLFESIKDYPEERHSFDIAMYGLSKMKKVQQIRDQANSMHAEGVSMEDAGREMARQSRLQLPVLPSHPAMMKQVHELYAIAQTKHYVESLGCTEIVQRNADENSIAQIVDDDVVAYKKSLNRNNEEIVLTLSKDLMDSLRQNR